MRVWFEWLGVSCSRTAYGVGSAPPPCTPHEYRCMTSHQHLQERQAPIAATIIVTNFGTQPRFIQKYLSIAPFCSSKFQDNDELWPGILRPNTRGNLST
jgi:hypothetical protein